MIRRICLCGASGTGKSTLAAKLFSTFKEDHYSIELVTEYVKPFAYQKRFPQSYDGVYIFGKQLHAEDVYLRHVNTIITDSPLLLSIVYSKYYHVNFWEHLIPLMQNVDEKYPPLYFYLHRRDDYDPNGRYQSVEQQIEIDEVLIDCMKNYLPQSNCYYDKLPFDQIVSTIKERIWNEK